MVFCTPTKAAAMCCTDSAVCGVQHQHAAASYKGQCEALQQEVGLLRRSQSDKTVELERLRSELIQVGNKHQVGCAVRGGFQLDGVCC
jgi:hypothetical protein